MRQFYITSWHDVFEDIFDKGEQPNAINGYAISEKVEAPTALEAVIKYVTETLGYPVTDGSIEADDEQNNVVHYSTLVDMDNDAVDEHQTEQWKEGKLRLYSNHVTIEVKELITVMIY